MNKTLIFMRGLPGSGKSYSVKVLKGNGVIHSTDSYFMVNGKTYIFDVSKVKLYHEYNLIASQVSMIQGLTPIIIDNVNLKAKHVIRYVRSALKNNYEIVVIETTTPWAFDIEELFKRNKHGVSKETLQQMKNDYEPHYKFIENIVKYVKENKEENIKGLR